MNNRNIFLALAVGTHRGLVHFMSKAHVLEELEIWLPLQVSRHGTQLAIQFEIKKEEHRMNEQRSEG